MIKQVSLLNDIPSTKINVNAVNSMYEIIAKKDTAAFQAKYVGYGDWKFEGLVCSPEKELIDLMKWALSLGYEVYACNSQKEADSLLPKKLTIKKGMFLLLRNDLLDGRSYGNDSWVSKMKKNCIVKVKEIQSNGKFYIHDDNPKSYGGSYNYTAEMVANEVTIDEGMRVKLTKNVECFRTGDIITIHDLKSDGSFVGYKDNDRRHTHTIKLDSIELLVDWEIGDKAEVTVSNFWYNKGDRVTVTGRREDGYVFITSGITRAINPDYLRKVS